MFIGAELIKEKERRNKMDRIYVAGRRSDIINCLTDWPAFVSRAASGARAADGQERSLVSASISRRRRGARTLDAMACFHTCGREICSIFLGSPPKKILALPCGQFRFILATVQRSSVPAEAIHTGFVAGDGDIILNNTEL